MKWISMLIFLCGCLVPAVQATGMQARVIRGIVATEEGEPLAGVTVVIKGTSARTLTDDEGAFAINASVDQGILGFTAVGYEQAEIAFSSTTAHLQVQMTSSMSSLDEVVVLGYGEQSKQLLTSAVSRLDGDAIRDNPITSIGDGIKGKLAGVRVTSNNNSPGSGVTIRVRGGSSINNSNSPLILVDGVERDLVGINPNDIASIDVLKDAASSAIYGARASNGVVLITTRRGDYGSPVKVTFETNVAHQNIESRIDFLNAEDYLRILRPAIANSPNPGWNTRSGFSTSTNNTGNSIMSTRYYNPGDPLPAGWKTMVDPIDESRMLMFHDADWQNLMYNSAYWQNHYVNVNGGSEKIRYAGSVGYTGDQGVAIGTGYRRFNIRSNTDAKISDKLSVSMGLDYAKSFKEEYPNQRNTISRGLANPPTMLVYREDGTPVSGWNGSALTPIFTDYITDRSNNENYLSIIGGLKYELLQGLTFDINGSYFENMYKSSSFERAHEYNGSRPATADFSQLSRAKIDAYFTYNKRVMDDHSLSVMAGYSYQKRNSESMGAGAEGSSSDKIRTLNAAPILTRATSNQTEDVIIGYFGRVSYDYKKKYILTATMRQDGSSKFAEGNRWGFFPGVSAGWIVTNERFMQNLDPLSFLKIRTSYGRTGNNAIGVYDAFGGFNAGYRYFGNAGLRQTGMQNRDLTWETTTQLDLGLELGFFNDRLYFSGDYFNKVTTDLLFDRPLPNTTGFSSIQTNIGSVKFYGFELELTSRNIQKENFSWESSLVYSFTKNRVLSLPDNGIEGNRIGGIALGDGTFFGGTAEGESLYRFYGYKVDRILQNDQEAANAHFDELARGFDPADGQSVVGRKLPGDYEWVDRNGDGRINSSDRFELGVSVAPITGGLNNSFRYKNFSLSVYVDWALGHSIYDESYQRYFLATFNGNYALAEGVKDTWKQEGDNAKYARFVANDSGTGNQNFHRMSDAFTYRGDYLSLRDVALQYNIPDTWASKLGVSNATFTLAGHSLFYLSAVNGISPESGAASTYSGGYSNYPPVRRVTVGARLTF